MKLLNLLLFLSFFLCATAQNTLFKNNLFNDSRYLAEVTENNQIYKLFFLKEENPPDSCILYSWEYNTVLKAFQRQFESDEICDQTDKITEEAGRVFFQVEAKNKLTQKTGSGPSAGTFGFVNKEVIARRSIEYRRIYIKELKDAKKAFRKGTNNYHQFIDYSGCKLIDTIFDKTRAYRAHYLKKKEFGVKSYANSEINKFYTSHLFVQQKGTYYLKKVDELINIQNQLRNEKLRIPPTGRLKLINDQIKNDSIQLAKVNKLIQELTEQLSSAKYNELKKLNETDYKIIAKENLEIYRDFVKLIGQLSENKSSQSALKIHLEELLQEKELIETLITIEQELKDAELSLKKELAPYEEKYDLNNTISLLQLQKDLSEQRELNEKIQAKYGTSMVSLTVDSISIKVDKTFIESITVFCKILPSNNFDTNTQFRNGPVMFYNHEPIGISTLTSINRSLSTTSVFATIDNHLYEIDIRDVIAFYNPILMNGRNDLSPADTTFTLVKKVGEQTVNVNKTATQKLFEMKVYSDFVGLSGTTPNGLVQLEFSKEMYLSSQKYTRVFKKGFYYNTSWGTYITPFFTLSKLEKTNKFLPIITNDTLRGAKTLELKRYEMFSVGGDINLFSINVPRWKTQLFLDPGIAFARIGLSDSTYNGDSIKVYDPSSVNSFAVRGTAKLVFQTDERYFFDARLSFQWYKLLDGSIIQIKENLHEDFTGIKAFSSKFIFNIGLNAGFSPTTDTKGKLFFRYNYYGLAMEKALQGFSQIQLGYSYYLNN